MVAAMDAIHERALFIRHAAVEAEQMFTLEGLAMIVSPTLDVLRASLAAASREIDEERERFQELQRNAPPPPKREVRLIDLAA